VVSIFSRVSAVGVKVDKKARRRIARRASRLVAPTPRFNVSKAVKAQLQNRAIVKFIPKELLKKALQARPNQFVATEPTPPVRQNSDVQPLFTHLGLGTNPSLPDLATIRVPTYDLQDFEKDARTVSLFKTFVGGGGQSASFQFDVPTDRAVRLLAVGIAGQSGPGNSIWSLVVGWVGATESNVYARTNVETGNVPELLLGATQENSNDRWSREIPLDVPQGGAISINSGADFNGGDIVSITVHYQFIPTFRQVVSNADEWTVNP